jgi:uncharacterized membrane protein HdeD (DUF308 family)
MQTRNWMTGIINGLISVVIGIIITYLASLIWPPPWALGPAFIAVGTASFFAAFFTSLNRHSKPDTRT